MTGSRFFGVLCGLLALLVLTTTSCTRKNETALVRSRTVSSTPLGNPPSPTTYSQEQLDNTKGLSNSSVNCIFQDSQNLIWVGTWDGLNRYDGSSFKTFRPKQGDEKSLSNQVVLKVAEDKSGRIWVLTMHGINSYDKISGEFTQFYFSRKEMPPLSESEFNMALDASGRVFCAVKDWGIGYFDGKSFRQLNGRKTLDHTVRKMEVAPGGDLLLLFENAALHSLKLDSADSVPRIVSDKIIKTQVRSFETGEDNHIFVSTLNGKGLLLDGSTKQEQEFSGNLERIVGKAGRGVLLRESQDYVLVDQQGNSTDSEWLGSIENQKITSFLCASENIIWTGTDGDGLFKHFPSRNAFQLVSRAQLPGLDGGIVRAFLETGSAFWVGTKGKGLFQLKVGGSQDNQRVQVVRVFNQGNSSLDNSVYALSQTTDGLVLIGTDGSGISVFDPGSSRLFSWGDIEGSSQWPDFRSVYAIYQDPEGVIWLGTNGHGLVKCRLSRKGSRLMVTDFFQYQAGPNGLSSNIVFSIVPKSDDELWIGTRLGGLNLLQKSSGKIVSYKSGSTDAPGLSSNDILSLANDSNGNLWIGTSYGLNQMIWKDGKVRFRSFTTSDGLPDNTVHGIVSNGSNLWLSTNFGLSDFAVVSGKFINYNRNDGLQNNEFADGAAYRSSSGHIYMGGIKGYNFFLPQRIKESAVIPNLLIDRISGQNQTTPYLQNLVISPESEAFWSLTLKHDQNFFDIQLSALTFIDNEKCQYAYQLSGFDKNWNAIGNRKIISFTNVPPGDYELWVKWSNKDGVWTQPVRAIEMRVKPVWWQSRVAFAVYVVLALGFLWFVRSYQLKRRSLSRTISIRKQEEELHENRLAFFTNVAHEFLTPLTLIAGPVQKLSETQSLDDKSRKFVQLVQRNTSRLLFLTQQLLEFRKAEHDYLEVTARQFDLTGLIEQIAELFDDWALDKGISYTLELPSALPGWYDKDKLEKIIFNLMSNAFKYTPDQGSIHLKVWQSPENDGRLLLSISNSGEGIPEEKIKFLFDRFFLGGEHPASNPEVLRTGIGLAYIKRLVTVLRGEIDVHSKAGELTTFTISIPCRKEDFKPGQLDFGNTPVWMSRQLRNILEERSEKNTLSPEKIASLDRVADTRKRILVVEDEKEIHEFLEDLLSEKYRIISAFDGLQALEHIASSPPDLIISDVMMPHLDGVELCRRVKTDMATCHIPFIMLTAKESVIHRIEGLESGANSYIPKPFYPEHLLVRIEKLLQEKEMILRHFTQDEPVVSGVAESVNAQEKEFIRKVIDLIRAHVDREELQSAFIEKELGISNSQLYRKTKQLFGISPADLIRTIRLKYAAELLRKDTHTVSEVCYKSGFNNRSYFYREFKKMYETTPKNYQMHYRSRSVSFSSN